MNAVNPAVSLEAFLAAKDDRARRQAAQLRDHGASLVSLTAVMPGGQKCGALPTAILSAARDVLTSSLEKMCWPILYQQYLEPVSGPEWLVSIDADANELKKWTIALEETHPIGRLWDIDVFAQAGRPLSRVQFDFPPRLCLFCDNEARICARLQRHSTAELLARMMEIMQSYEDTRQTS